MPVSLPHIFANKTTIVGADLDQQFAALTAKFAAAIATGDLAAAAGILLTQIVASKEHIDVLLHVEDTIDTAWGTTDPAIPYIVVPVPEVSGVSWTATHCYWVCNNTGGGLGTFAVEWGAFNTAGAWIKVADVGSGTMINPTGGAGLANQGVGAVAGGTVALAQTTTARGLALIPDGADVTTLDNSTRGANREFVSVVVRLRRDISDS